MRLRAGSLPIGPLERSRWRLRRTRHLWRLDQAFGRPAEHHGALLGVRRLSGPARPCPDWVSCSAVNRQEPSRLFVLTAQRLPNGSEWMVGYSEAIQLDVQSLIGENRPPRIRLERALWEPSGLLRMEVGSQRIVVGGDWSAITLPLTSFH